MLQSLHQVLPNTILYITKLAQSTSQYLQTSCDRHLKISILPVFLMIEPHFVRKGCAGRKKVATLLVFLTIEPHFVRHDCAGRKKVAILPQILTISFRAKGLRGTQEGRDFTSVFDDRTSFRLRVAFRGASLALPRTLIEK